MNIRRAQSATSLRRAPRDEASARMVRYSIMMGIRLVCFILMAVVQPLGWYTWVFAAGAIFLPYIAVVITNVGDANGDTPDAETPTREIESPSDEPAAPTAPTVLKIAETYAMPPRETNDDR